MHRQFIVCAIAIPLFALGWLDAARANAISNEGARAYEEEYEVTAAPMPAPWVLPPSIKGCLSGLEGVHKDTRTLVAPFAGWLKVSLSFRGDWDLYLLDDKEQLLAFSNYGGETLSLQHEEIEYFLRDEQEVMVAACNLSGTPTAKARLHLTAGSPFEPKRAVRTRTITDRYSAPVAGAEESWIACYRDAGMGCISADVRPGERRVTVSVSDDVSDPVAAFVYQYNGSTGYGGQWICGKTRRPILIKPGADWVGVSIKAAASCGQRKTAGTSGTVTFRISG